MSRRHAAMRRERDKVEREGMRDSLESGALRREVGWEGVPEEREAVGRRKEESIEGMDFVV